MSISIASVSLDPGIVVTATNGTSSTKFQIFQQDRTSENLKDGAGAYVFDRVFSATSKTLADTTNEDVDLYDLGTYDLGNGAGRDSLGMSHANATIRYMLVRCLSSSTGSLIVNTSVANGWTAWLPSGTFTLTPGAIMEGYFPAGLAVTDASNHLLRLTATGGDADYDLQFLSKQ